MRVAQMMFPSRPGMTRREVYSEAKEAWYDDDKLQSTMFPFVYYTPENSDREVVALLDGWMIEGMDWPELLAATEDLPGDPRWDEVG